MLRLKVLHLRLLPDQNIGHLILLTVEPLDLDETNGQLQPLLVLNGVLTIVKPIVIPRAVGRPNRTLIDKHQTSSFEKYMYEYTKLSECC